MDDQGTSIVRRDNNFTGKHGVMQLTASFEVVLCKVAKRAKRQYMGPSLKP
jgi:hypothetical protein